MCKIDSLETQLEGPCNFYPKPSKMFAKAPALTPRFQIREQDEYFKKQHNANAMVNIKTN